MFPKLQEPSYDRSNWQRPKTTRRYIHPPKSERMFTLWAEGKIIYGDVIDGSDVIDKRNGHEYYRELVSCGMWMHHGAGREQFDFRKVENLLTSDGVPVHGLKYRLGNMEIAEEAFCNTVRKTSCYIRVSIKNTGETAETQRISFFLRTGPETGLVAGGSDQYKDYDPIGDNRIPKHPSTWKEIDGGYTDGERVLTVSSSDTAPRWDSKEGVIDFDFELAPGGSKEIIFVLNKGEKVGLNYFDEKARTETFWRKELKRLNKLPKAWTKDEGKLRMVRHWTTQLLQCFAYPVDKDYLLWRQGGLQRIIWPGEVQYCFEALAGIGDFSEYLEAVLDTYFNVMQAPDGEMINIGIQWAMVTCTVLFSFGKYCTNAGEAGRKCYDRYRDQAFLAFDWVKRTRRSTIGCEDLAQGLFPPLRSCDWPDNFQAWGTTDTNNLIGLAAFKEAAEKFGDLRAAEVRAEHTEYLEAMRKYAGPFAEAAKDSDELYIPLCPIGDDSKIVEGLFPLLHHGDFGRLGILENKKDVYKIYKGLVDSGRSNGGLYGRMIIWDKRHMWYMSVAEFCWFECWRRFGERGKMEEILCDQLQYNMTDEYAMQERYVEDAPYFAPWSPNASAMGRTLLMMLALEGINS